MHEYKIVIHSKGLLTSEELQDIWDTLGSKGIKVLRIERKNNKEKVRCHEDYEIEI